MDRGDDGTALKALDTLEADVKGGSVGVPVLSSAVTKWVDGAVH